MQRNSKRKKTKINTKKKSKDKHKSKHKDKHRAKDKEKDVDKHRKRERERDKEKNRQREDEGGNAKRAKTEEPETIQCLHILVKHNQSRRPFSWKEQNVTRTIEEATKTINDFRRRIQDKSATFEELAKTESHCSSHEKGGDLGRFGRRKMQKSFEDAAFALKVGELSNAVFSDSGVHLIYRTE